MLWEPPRLRFWALAGIFFPGIKVKEGLTLVGAFLEGITPTS
jgi:hypothetical protein